MAAGWAETRFANEIRSLPAARPIGMFDYAGKNAHTRGKQGVRWIAPSKHCSDAPRTIHASSGTQKGRLCWLSAPG